MSEGMRLQKWLSQAGIASRRKAEELILAGKVAVNGVTVTELGARAGVNDLITVGGKPCLIAEEKIYIALHKPEGVVTTVTDPHGRRTVMDFLPQGTNCHPVGRLDYDTSGLIIMTNDGELTQRLTHPKHGVDKTYVATVEGVPSKEALAAFRAGLLIEGRKTAPAEVEICNTKKGAATKLRIKIHEGRNRQVRKMCEAIGHQVLALKRVAVGVVKLGALPRGQWRELTRAEIRGLGR